MPITNTANDPRPEWLFGLNPSAIEDQEKRGQEELIESSQLPAKTNPHSDISAIDFYAEMGIKVIGQTKGDDLFVDVVLPNGWQKRPTDHSMWSELVDDKGDVRATMFYKAAFYDREAFINKP